MLRKSITTRLSGIGRLIYPAVAAGIGCVLLLFPLVRSFHLDSAVLAGTLGAFAGAWMAARPAARNRDALWLTALVYTASIPLIIRDALTGCISTDGAAFWLFIPVFSIFFGFSAGRAIRYLGIPVPRLVSMLFVFLVGAGSVLASMYFFPQLFFFNHVFGFWPGAIYDQAVLFPGRMVLYRFITLGWIAAFWMLPHLRGSDRILKGIFALILFSITLNYLLAAQHGLVSPESRIRAGLGGIHQTEHFRLFYSKSHFEPYEVDLLGRLHEFHFRELTDTLQIDWPEGKRIHSYLYGNEWQMQQLTGAKGVSYVPVWNRRPQMHMRKTAIDGTLRHELVHVVARQFGNRLLNASWSIGLVEGLAVALAPASSTRLTYDQMVVSNDAFFSLEELEQLFSLTGFYRRPGSAAYAVSGSFVATLLQEFPLDHFKEAYRRSSLRRGYGERLPDAVRNWHERVAGVEVPEEDRALAEALFTAPSLFDERCPRTWTTEHRKRDAYRFALAEGDSARALALLGDVLDAEPHWEAGWMAWLQLRLETEWHNSSGLASAAEVVAGAFGRHPDLAEHPLLRVRLADAYASAGKWDRAVALRDQRPHRPAGTETGRTSMETGRSSVESLQGGPLTIEQNAKKEIHTNRSRMALADKLAGQAWQRRSDPERWEKLVRILYKPGLSVEHPPDFLVDLGDAMLLRAFFAEWFRRNPVPAAEQFSAVELIRKALEAPVDPDFFETYRNLIYMVSPVLPAGFFEERLAGEDWSPVRQARLEEALRFAGS